MTDQDPVSFFHEQEEDDLYENMAHADELYTRIATEEASDPRIVVESDYDGYFELLTREIMRAKKGPWKHQTIVVSAGPYRVDACRVTTRSPGTVNIDFYAALRNGFGQLLPSQYAEIADLL